MRRGHRSLEAEVGKSTFMALRRLKQFEKVKNKVKEKELYHNLQRTVRRMFSKCCGKRKRMIYLLNLLEKIKSSDKLICEAKLANLRARRALYKGTKISQKYIIKRMLQQMKCFAKEIENANTSTAIIELEVVERSVIENIGDMANEDLHWNRMVRKRIREVDTEIVQQEKILALL